MMPMPMMVMVGGGRFCQSFLFRLLHLMQQFMSLP
uniref:Uncharacterized protein n=1 Tax=Anopheles christyi TaxID=43041 RepID=A0A182KHX6_9DIPT